MTPMRVRRRYPAGQRRDGGGRFPVSAAPHAERHLCDGTFDAMSGIWLQAKTARATPSRRRGRRLAGRRWFGRAISLQQCAVFRREGLRASRAGTARRGNLRAGTARPSSVQFPRSVPPTNLPASRSQSELRRAFVSGAAGNLDTPTPVLPEHIERRSARPSGCTRIITRPPHRFSLWCSAWSICSAVRGSSVC
jgi:hypothetical protein